MYVYMYLSLILSAFSCSLIDEAVGLSEGKKLVLCVISLSSGEWFEMALF
jgi:hypothetical protein